MRTSPMDTIGSPAKSVRVTRRSKCMARTDSEVDRSGCSRILCGMKVTYYLEVLSSWCHWVEPTWLELKQRYAGKVNFDWKVALMRPEDFPASQSQCDWFYRRSGTVVRSPYMLNSGWFQAEKKGDYSAPNLVAEAGRDLGFTDDRLRLVLSHAALREGKKIGDLNTAIEVAVREMSADAAKLRSLATSGEVAKRVQSSTAEFHALQIPCRPAFVLEDGIGDKAVFSGLVRIEPLVATIEAMLADTAAYETHRIHFGNVPSD